MNQKLLIHNDEGIKNKTLCFAVNNATFKICYVTENFIIQRDLLTLKNDWVQSFNDLFLDIFNMHIQCKDAVISQVLYLNMWAVVLNKKYMLFIENETRYSKPVVLDWQVCAIQVLNYSNEIFLQKDDRRTI